MTMRDLPWSEIKRLVDEKALVLQWVRPISGEYFVYVADGPVTFWHTLLSGNADYTEFEASYKTATSRRVANTPTALPNPEDYRFRGTATAWTECPAGQTTDIDITPSATEDRWVSGGFVVHKDANPGDTVGFKVVHPQVGPVETYVPSWIVTPGTGSQKIEVYPARIPAGLILRVSYTNVGSASAYCGINYLLHRRGTGT